MRVCVDFNRESYPGVRVSPVESGAEGVDLPDDLAARALAAQAESDAVEEALLEWGLASGAMNDNEIRNVWRLR